MHDTIPQPARDALEAVREALDIPHAATVGGDAVRAKILDHRLDHRLGHAVTMLKGIPGEDIAPDVAWSVACLRARLAEHPAAGYKTWDQCIAEMRATEDAATEDAAAEHAAATCGTCGASGADETLESARWTALSDGSVTVRWLCADRRACNSRRFPGLAALLGEACADGAR